VGGVGDGGLVEDNPLGDVRRVEMMVVVDLQGLRDGGVTRGGISGGDAMHYSWE
jgi:hypothetical protein